MTLLKDLSLVFLNCKVIKRRKLEEGEILGYGLLSEKRCVIKGILSQILILVDEEVSPSAVSLWMVPETWLRCHLDNVFQSVPRKKRVELQSA